MELWILVVVILLVAVILGITIGSLIVFQSKNKEYMDCESQDTMPVYANRWMIELWDIGNGERYRAEFSGGLTLGRGSMNRHSHGFLYIGEDVTLSREQCLVFEQSGVIFVSNLSQVNVTYLNGNVVAQPMPIGVGDRLATGGHTYLITTLSQQTTILNAGDTVGVYQ